mmetsp:Transcript_7651/g.28665  ORF Transcript_7651/g.28665 Transcript_7651/m.28665 type:complete len:327 (+) Transcript_7651:784-1764(+)
MSMFAAEWSSSHSRIKFSGAMSFTQCMRAHRGFKRRYRKTSRCGSATTVGARASRWWNLNQHAGAKASAVYVSHGLSPFRCGATFRETRGTNSTTTPLGKVVTLAIFKPRRPRASVSHRVSSFSRVSTPSNKDTDDPTSPSPPTAFRMKSPTAAAFVCALMGGASLGAAARSFLRVAASIKRGGPGEKNTAPHDTGHVNAPVRSISNALTTPPTWRHRFQFRLSRGYTELAVSSLFTFRAPSRGSWPRSSREALPRFFPDGFVLFFSSSSSSPSTHDPTIHSASSGSDLSHGFLYSSSSLVSSSCTKNVVHPACVSKDWYENVSVG